ncbi:MAG: polyprenyl synthetase family protein [Candidatus Gastranaerophilales bacterium]|nr:polyprenyl synthetase family protein [Candidatus Gastranaerophilales bacterium]
MISSSVKNTKKVNLTDILKPIEAELRLLEEKIAAGTSSENFLLSQITGYIFQSGGKKLRPAICFLIGKLFNNEILSKEHFELGKAIEIIHTATLIHDDFIDDADLRRGNITVNKKWNAKMAVIAGDFLLAKALHSLALIKNNRIVEIFATAMNDICEGEIQQNSQINEIITMDEYIEKSKRKTAILFLAGAESAAILIPNTENEQISAVRNYALNFGIGFQIIDDLLNFIPGQKSYKSLKIDLINGIYTAPVLFALQENNSLLSALEAKNIDYAVEIINKSDGFAKTIKLANKYLNNAEISLQNLPDTQSKQALINLCNFVLAQVSL